MFVMYAKCKLCGRFIRYVLQRGCRKLSERQCGCGGRYSRVKAKEAVATRSEVPHA